MGKKCQALFPCKEPCRQEWLMALLFQKFPNQGFYEVYSQGPCLGGIAQAGGLY